MGYLVKNMMKFKDYIHVDVIISHNKNKCDIEFSQEKFLYSQ